MVIFKILGKILGLGLALASVAIVVVIIAGTAGAVSGIVNMPDEDGGPSLKENWETVAKPMLKEGWENADTATSKINPYLSEYSGKYTVFGDVSYQGEIYELKENGSLQLTYLENNSPKKIYKGKWTCRENTISIKISEEGWSEDYKYYDEIWENAIGNRQMKK